MMARILLYNERLSRVVAKEMDNTIAIYDYSLLSSLSF